MDVFVPTHLQSYTSGRACVQANGDTLADVLADLDRQFPGIRFRMIDEQDAIRPHMRLFIGTEAATTIAERIPSGAPVHIIAALSGG